MAVCTYWFATKTVIMAVLLWRRRLFVWRMMAIMRACAKSTGASGSATRGIRQRMAVRTSRNRCDLKIWIRKEHHQRSYLVHLNLCSHFMFSDLEPYSISLNCTCYPIYFYTISYTNIPMVFKIVILTLLVIMEVSEVKWKEGCSFASLLLSCARKRTGWLMIYVQLCL